MPVFFFQLDTTGESAKMTAKVSIHTCWSTLSQPLCTVAQRGHIGGYRWLCEGKAIEDYNWMGGLGILRQIQTNRDFEPLLVTGQCLSLQIYAAGGTKESPP